MALRPQIGRIVEKAPPPLTYIRSFECSARHLSFTRAADELGCTQAAVSVHIRSLERYLGSKLFHRHPRSLALTEIGAAFLPTLRQALQMIDQATETVVIGNQTRTVTISCPMSLAENWLSRRLVGFAAANPKIELLIYGSLWGEPEGISADLVVSMNRADEIPRGAELMLRDTLSLLCAPEVATTIDRLEDLQQLPRIIVLGRQEYWTAFHPSLGDMSNQDATAFRTNATNIALEMAANGIGIIAAPSDLARTYVQRGLLVEPFDLRPDCPWSYYISHASHSRNSASQAVKNWLMEGE